MLLRTHLAIAVLFLLSAFNYINGKIIFIVFFLLASFFPDIDTKTSKAGSSIFLRPLQLFLSHRGIFHSFIFLSILSAIIYTFSQIAGTAFFSGCLLHLLLDALTPNGIKFFWPISNFKISFFIKSGSIIEEIIFVLVLLGDVFLIVSKIIKF